MNKQQRTALHTAKDRAVNNDTNVSIYMEPGVLHVLIDEKGMVRIHLLKNASKKLFDEVQAECKKLFSLVNAKPTEFLPGTSAVHCLV